MRGRATTIINLGASYKLAQSLKRKKGSPEENNLNVNKLL